MRGRNKRRRWTALAGALFMAVSGQVGLMLAASAPAAAIPGLVATLPAFTNANNETPKTLIRECPTGTVIMGISGVVDDFGANAVRLIYLEPMSNTLFRVIAASQTGFNQAWQLGIAARCAPAPAGYQIIPSPPTTPSSATFQQAIATCTNNRIAIGAAARVNVDNAGAREVALQLVRTSGPMDIVRATAREDANGFAGNWSVTAYAICVNGVGQAPAPGGLAFGTTDTFVACPNNTFVHGYGGGGSTSDVTGNVWLNGISASNQTASASFTGVPNDGIVAQAICAP